MLVAQVVPDSRRKHAAHTNKTFYEKRLQGTVILCYKNYGIWLQS